jgi:hypothetical protein
MKAFPSRGALLAAFFFISPSWAQDSIKSTIGNFYVETTKDPFSDSSTVVAITGAATDLLGLRCLSNYLSIIILNDNEGKKWSKGDHFHIKFRADNKVIIDTEGTALDNKAIEISEDSEALLNDMIDAKSVAFKITASTGIFYQFSVPLKQPDKVVMIVKKACGK